MDKENKGEVTKPKCTHPETYISVRHVSGISIRRCKTCGALC